MIEILVVVLAIALLAAVAFIAFAAGFAVDVYFVIKTLKEKGWTVEPPEDGRGWNETD